MNKTASARRAAAASALVASAKRRTDPALVELDLEGNELPGDGGAHAMGGEWVGADGRWVKAPPPEEEPASGDDAEEQGEGVESADG